ncbi:MAG: N-acetylmuramidase domain-containing protein [Bacteroidales bacterium]|nr:N-acetylmuramidase domain-containing protein [Bacteroidales bacterium]
MGWLANLFGFNKKKKAKETNTKTTTTTTTTTKTNSNTNSVISKGMVTASTLNARDKASTDGKVLFKLKKNTIVSIIGEDGDWYHISTEIGTAYCVTQYIKKTTVVEKVEVNAKVLNVRAYYNTGSSIIGKVNKGDILVVVSKHKGWYGIDLKGKTGYVSADYVSFVGENSNSSNNSSSKTTTTTTTKTDSSRVFFNTRSDLKKVDLAPSKQLSTEGQDRYGKIAVKTWNKYGNLVTKISKELDIPVEIALAVICVESGGDGMAADGKMLIRFENHVFYTYYAKTDETKKEYEKHFTFNQNSKRDDHKYRQKKSDDWKTSHNGQSTEWEAFEIARALDEQKAMYSISMGAPQVMGFNYKSIGYSSVKEMYDAFAKDIRYHIMALFDFCNAKAQRVEYLAKGDFLSFAKEYNGLAAPAQYEKRLQQYYDIYKKIL